MPDRTVFFVSDGTGITAETFGNSILAQFPTKPRHVRRPFIDSVLKAEQLVAEINTVAEREGKRPIAFITLVNEEIRDIVSGPGNKALVLDMEAGVEHLGRGTVRAVDGLVIVVEPGRRSVETARRSPPGWRRSWSPIACLPTRRCLRGTR